MIMFAFKFTLTIYALLANQCTSCRAQVAVEKYCVWGQFQCGPGFINANMELNVI